MKIDSFGRYKKPIPWMDRARGVLCVPRLLHLAWQSSRTWLLCALLTRLLLALTPIALFWIPKLIIDVVVRSLRGTNVDMKHLYYLIAIQFILMLTSEILMRSTVLSDAMLEEKLTTSVNIKLIETATLLDLTQLESPELYDKLEQVRTQGYARANLLISFVTVIQELITLTTLFAGFLLLSHWLFTVLVLSSLPPLFFEGHAGSKRYELMRYLAPLRRKLDYLRHLGTTIETAKEIRVFGLGSYLIDSYRSMALIVLKQTRSTGTQRIVQGSVVGLICLCGYFSVYVAALAQVLSGAITLGTFTFIASSFLRSRGSIERISLNLHTISENSLKLRDLFHLFDLYPSISSKGPFHPLPEKIQSGIEFRNVSFAYPGSKTRVLKNINLQIAVGEMIGLVGENGSGKSTMVKLLTRLYDPSEGKILLDGCDIRLYSSEDYRRRISVIFQDFMKYDLPMRENIGFGKTTYITNDAQLKHAAESAKLQQIISRLPEGYDQVLGRRFERGCDLSGGEWQRVALARAYIRDAEIMILDEPSSALDARSESEVFQKFKTVASGRIAVVISHRFVTIRLADKIVVLVDGAIEEQGTHAELLGANGRYAELYDLQASGYR